MRIASVIKLLVLATISIFLVSCGPTARFTYQQSDKVAPSIVDFQNDSKKAESYTWDFGDGKTSSDENPNHKYYLSGKYEVALTAKKGRKEKVTVQEIYVDAPDICLLALETDYGTIIMHLFDNTPKHRDNFIKLAEEGFFDGLLFHRVIDGFMIQGGDPNSRDAKAGKPLGSGGPGYQIPAEFNKNNVHIRGAIAAARTSDSMNPQKKSSGSQFYIVHGKPLEESQLKNFELMKGLQYTDEQKRIFLEVGGTPFLDMEYTVFGQVLEGFDVIEEIAQAKKDNRDRPIEDIKMQLNVIK